MAQPLSCCVAIQTSRYMIDQTRATAQSTCALCCEGGCTALIMHCKGILDASMRTGRSVYLSHHNCCRRAGHRNRFMATSGSCASASTSWLTTWRMCSMSWLLTPAINRQRCITLYGTLAGGSLPGRLCKGQSLQLQPTVGRQ